jgi:hypothetical protein
MAPKDAKRTEVLSMRLDPKTRFLVEILARLRGQNITMVVERSIQEAADATVIGRDGSWRDYWHIEEGVRSLKMAADERLYPTFEDEYRLEFAKTHWPFFFGSSSCNAYLELSIRVLWPKIDEFVAVWRKTQSTDYFAAGKAMQKALSDAGIKAPDWPVKPRVVEKQATSRGGGGPSWEAPKGGDLDDEIPF